MPGTYTTCKLLTYFFSKGLIGGNSSSSHSYFQMDIDNVLAEKIYLEYNKNTNFTLLQCVDVLPELFN